MTRYLKINPADNVAVALVDLYSRGSESTNG